MPLVGPGRDVTIEERNELMEITCVVSYGRLDCVQLDGEHAVRVQRSRLGRFTYSVVVSVDPEAKTVPNGIVLVDHPVGVPAVSRVIVDG